MEIGGEGWVELERRSRLVGGLVEPRSAVGMNINRVWRRKDVGAAITRSD